MNDKMSIVLATAVLAFGGIGLYMYKQINEDDNDSEDDYSVKEDPETETIFNFSKIFGLDKDNLEDNCDELSSIDSEYEYYEPKKKQTAIKTKVKSNTKRNRKSNGSTKRRY